MAKAIYRRILYLINFTLLIICIINSCDVLYRLLNPELPSIHEYNTNLNTIEFPLSFRICFNYLSGNSERFQKWGYDRDYDFYLGKSKGMV